jgi:hypothetical protein
MRFTPKTEAEIEAEAAARGPFKPGIYDFDVINALDEVSKSGNDMITLEIRVFDGNGETKKITDWLVDKIAYKVRHAAYSVGLGREYEAGKLEASDFLNRSGKVKLKIKQENPYPPRNVVYDYVVEDKPANVSSSRPPARKSVPAGGGDSFDDDIPFAAEWR